MGVGGGKGLFVSQLEGKVMATGHTALANQNPEEMNVIM